MPERPAIQARRVLKSSSSSGINVRRPPTVHQDRSPWEQPLLPSVSVDGDEAPELIDDLLYKLIST